MARLFIFCSADIVVRVICTGETLCDDLVEHFRQAWLDIFELDIDFRPIAKFSAVEFLVGEFRDAGMLYDGQHAIDA